MAEIDLKQARIYIRDGFSAAGAVNNVAGYTAGGTTTLVDAIGGIIPTGTLLTFAGHATIYTVVSHIETSGSTTSITFTPALTATVADNAVITFQPHSVEVRIGEGNLTYTEKKARTYKKDRGKLYTVKNGDEDPVEVTLSASWESIHGDTDDPPSIQDVIKGTGSASTWVSGAEDPCEPYAVNIVIDYIEECGDGDIQRITLADFRWEEMAYDPKAGTIEVKGNCNITEAVTEFIAA